MISDRIIYMMGSFSWIDYLNDPHLVAKFQEYFGIKRHPKLSVKKRSSSKKLSADGLTPRSSSSLPKNYTINLTNENLRERSNRSHNGDGDEEFPSYKSGTSSSGISCCGSATNSNTSLSTNENESSGLGSSNENEDDDETSYESEIPDTPEDSLTTNKRNYSIGNKFWYYLFCFGSGLGDELFYASFFSFWFWNIDGSVCRRVVLIWGILMYIGKTLN